MLDSTEFPSRGKVAQRLRRVHFESEPFRWLGGAMLAALALALLLVWWAATAPARAAPAIEAGTMTFPVTCDTAYCMVDRRGMQALIQANVDLVARLKARADGCSQRGSSL